MAIFRFFVAHFLLLTGRLLGGKKKQGTLGKNELGQFKEVGKDVWEEGVGGGVGGRRKRGRRGEVKGGK